MVACITPRVGQWLLVGSCGMVSACVSVCWARRGRGDIASFVGDFRCVCV